MKLELALAVSTGLLGGFGHCLGMCGPLLAAVNLPFREASWWHRAAANGLYHLGRVTTYAFIGLVMGITGSFVNTAGAMAGVQEAVAIVAGLLMIAMGTGMVISTDWLRRLEAAVVKRMGAATRAVLDARGLGRFFALGLLLGFLPCGLSYAIFAGAAGSGHPVAGALFAFSFGLATVPPLLAAGMLASALGQRLRGWLVRLGGLVVAAAGLVYLVRGVRVFADL